MESKIFHKNLNTATKGNYKQADSLNLEPIKRDE